MQRVFILALSMPYMGIALQAKHALRTARRLPPRSRALASGELNDDATIYHIPEGPPHPNLKATVVKHLRHRNTFIERHKPSEHTLEALDVARQFVADFYSRRHHEESADVGEGDNFQSKALPVILDSGCGTGRSSAILAAAYPHMPVLGLDRSLARIAKNKFYNRVTNVGREAREGAALAGASEDDYGEDVSNRNDKRSLEAPDESNLLLLRCDVVDFWRGADAEVANQRWHVPLHTILYPNPYPKAKHLSARWHGHPCWPDLLLVCADVLLLRASWKQYLDEFASAVLMNLALATLVGSGVSRFSVEGALV
jgi:tRNA G46 methylase TrmB